MVVSASGAATASTSSRHALARPSAASVSCAARAGEYSKAYLDSVYRAMWTISDVAEAGLGQTSRAVDLYLPTGDEELAALVEHRFGSAVQLSVAGVSYCHGPGRTPACPTLTHGDSWPKGLHLSLALHTNYIEPTQTLSATLTVRWTGSGRFKMDVGEPLLADTVKTGTLAVRAAFTGLVAGGGMDVDLTDGQVQQIPVEVGTSRCGGSRGSALPAGHYGVRVVLESEQRSDHRQYLSPQAALQVGGPPS